MADTTLDQVCAQLATLTEKVEAMSRLEGRRAKPGTIIDTETAAVRPDEEMDWPKVAEYLGHARRRRRGPMAGPAVSRRQRQPHVSDLVSARRNTCCAGRRSGRLHLARTTWRANTKCCRGCTRRSISAPRSYHLVTDESVIGAKFIVVQRRTGVVIRERFPDAMLAHPRLAERASYALIDAMAELHNVDPTRTGSATSVGLTDSSKRQVEGWAARWELAKDKDVPLFYEVHRRLEAAVPSPQRVSVLHNDLKFDNCQFHPRIPIA